jgi:hypothetical protein
MNRAYSTSFARPTQKIQNLLNRAAARLGGNSQSEVSELNHETALEMEFSQEAPTTMLDSFHITTVFPFASHQQRNNSIFSMNHHC